MCPLLKRSVVGSILLSGPSCSFGYFPFQPVVHNWFIKGRGMYCSVYGKVHIKDPLLLIENSSLCGGSGFPSMCSSGVVKQNKLYFKLYIHCFTYFSVSYVDSLVEQHKGKISMDQLCLIATSRVSEKSSKSKSLAICIVHSWPSSSSTTGIAKAVVCAILSVGWCI